MTPYTPEERQKAALDLGREYDLHNEGKNLVFEHHLNSWGMLLTKQCALNSAQAELAEARELLRKVSDHFSLMQQLADAKTCKANGKRIATKVALTGEAIAGKRAIDAFLANAAHPKPEVQG